MEEKMEIDDSFPSSSSSSSLSLHTLPDSADGDPFDYIDEMLLTPLQIACCNNNYNEVLNLIKQGKELNSCDNRGFTALHYACKRESVETVKILLEQPLIRVDVQDFSGSTPLHIAATSNKTSEIIKLLIKANCDVNIQNNFGETALHELIYRGIGYSLKVEMISIILENGFDVSIINDFCCWIMDLTLFIKDEQKFEEYLNFLSMFLFYNIDVNCLYMTEVDRFYKPGPNTPFIQKKIGKVIELIFDYLDFTNSSEYYKCDKFYPYLELAICFENHRILQMLERGLDINYMINSRNCLKDSLRCGNNQLFKFFWEHCNRKELLEQDNYNLLLRVADDTPDFSKKDFLEVVYLLLESEFASQLVERANELCFYTIFNKNFVRYDFSKEERLKIIWTMLSFNNVVRFEDLIYVHDNYGFNEELEAFLMVTVEILNFRKIKHKMYYLCCPHVPISNDDLPLSLLELSRNAVRQNLRPHRNFFCYYNKVQCLNIPKKLKDIICLK